MAEKVIRVTVENRAKLQNRHQQDATGVDMAPGYFLVQQFGADDGNYELLSPAVFNQNYVLGEPLAVPGWHEAIPKSQVSIE